jgi:hypothetical protein
METISDFEKTFWELNKRTPWKLDSKYMNFHKEISDRKELFSFEQILKLTKVDKIVNPDDIKKYKLAWENEINKWNIDNDLECRNKIIGFAAICYLYTTFPKNKLNALKEYFKNDKFRLTVINELYYYQNNEDIGFDGIDYNISDGPSFPAAFSAWWDEKYNKNTFWIGYFAYEIINDLDFIKFVY